MRFQSGGACVHGNTAWCVEATTWTVLGIGIRSVLARAWSWSRSMREACVQADRAGSSAARPPRSRPRRNGAEELGGSKQQHRAGRGDAVEGEETAARCRGLARRVPRGKDGVKEHRRAGLGEGRRDKGLGAIEDDVLRSGETRAQRRHCSSSSRLMQRRRRCGPAGLRRES